MQAATEIVCFPDRLLGNDRFAGTSQNGLQVQNSGRCGADVSLPFCLKESDRCVCDFVDEGIHV
jgi:hypothetical protein